MSSGGSGAAPEASSSSSPAAAATPATARRLRAAVLGLGLAGRFFHVPHLAASPDFELVVCVQRSELGTALAADLAALAPRARLERDAAAALAAEDVDVVVIATPDATHFALAAEALRRGKHVLVDKPLVQTLAQAAALYALARGEARGRLCCMPYQNRRHCGDFLAVQQVLSEGTLGALVEYRAAYDRYRPEPRRIWKELDRGALDNLGPHVIDQALLLFGEPTRVLADVRALRAGAVTDDAFELQLFYDTGNAAASGAAAGGSASAPARRRIAGLVAPPRWRAVLSSSMLCAANERKFVLHGLDGSFEKSGLDGQEAMLCAGGPVRPDSAPGYGVEPPHLAGTLTLGATGASSTVPTPFGSYATMYSRFARAARSAEPLAEQEVPPEMAILLLRVIETARLSAASGRIEPLIEEPAAE
jgi:scyllo-inositol 2-dehydrogenase (NADP+)